ncbi:hypothetical protein ACJ72_01115 [Emergomyces africanus]|uniref:Uncharacterized protein n=1 Tax=Emergomyces africanus TaxID=1955775 RepID=A0A1B7P667_9EURO|nr:hypothetical protein ACJ72_01115 [Emergomyces africanus]
MVLDTSYETPGMSDLLHIPGIPTWPNNQAARKRNGPAFKTFPHRMTYKAVNIPHSFSSSLRSSVGSSGPSSSSTSSSVERYHPLAISRSQAQAGEITRPSAPIPSSRLSVLSKLQQFSSSRSAGSTSTTSSFSGPFVIPRTRPKAGGGPIASSRYSTLSKPQPLHTSARSSPLIHAPAPIPSSRFSSRSVPHSLGSSTRFAPPTRPSAPVPSSTYSTLSKPRYLHVPIRSSRSASTTLTRSALPSRPSAPVPSSQYSTFSKPQHIPLSSRSSRPTSATCSRSSPPALPACPFSAVSTRSSSGDFTSSDSFPSTRCFLSAALKAAALPCRLARPVSARVSTTRSTPLPPTPPIPAARFNRAGSCLKAALEVARRHRSERAQPGSSSSSSLTTVFSSHGSKDGSARAHSNVRRNIKSAKSVKFGGETVHEVDRWIKPGVHSQRGPPSVIGKLAGWSVTPLEKPQEDEDCKYTTYWGGEVSQLTHTHLPGKPCGRSFCSWNALANVQRGLCKIAQLNPNNPATSIRPRLVFEEFNRIREKMRGRGHCLL